MSKWMYGYKRLKKENEMLKAKIEELESGDE
jgi:cell division protein FtsB